MKKNFTIQEDLFMLEEISKAKEANANAALEPVYKYIGEKLNRSSSSIKGRYYRFQKVQKKLESKKLPWYKRFIAWVFN